MSEPYAAFMRLTIDRSALVGWLDSKPRPSQDWGDWREIGSDWTSIDWTRTPLYRTEDCEQPLTTAASIREAIDRAIREINAPYLGRAIYDPASRTFIAGSMLYSENLFSFIEFLSIARSASGWLKPGDEGLALIHNYIWDNGTIAAIRLGPGDQSAFLTASEYPSAIAAFQPVAGEMAGIGERQGEADNPPAAQNELDWLR